MASEQMRTISELIRAQPVLSGAPVEQLRANMEAMATVVPPPPDDVTYEPVDASGVPAEWVTAPGARTDAAVLYLHGGGYAIGSIATHRMMGANISRAAGVRVLLIDYRLAPEHPHPAAVEDATATYRWLLAQGLPPGNVAISGDSAGGGLTVATLLALRDAGDPLPACAVPMSPWLDMDQSAESYTTRCDLDPMCSAAGLKEMAEWYLAGQDQKTPLASPVHADLSGLPPLLVQVGDHEVLLDDSVRLVERAKAAGVDAALEIEEEGIHVFQAFPVPEAEAAIARLAVFVRRHIGSWSATTVYTDGACLGNPGPGGWAWAVPGGAFAAGPDPQTTNQRMEIAAVLDAVRHFDGPLEVVSDSTYVVNCFRDRWWEGWLARGWLNKAKKPVANRDLWEPLIDEYRRDPSRIRFTWVKGHSDDPMNDLVDRLAVEAARTQQVRRGDRPPETLGEADAPGTATAVDARLPAGHLLAVVGHRPPELGGYEANEVATGVLRRLTEVIDAQAQLHPDLVVLTGLGLGAEQLGAEAAEHAGVPYVAVLPYPDQESVWPAASRERYRRLLDGAQSTVVLQAKQPESKQQAGAALARRDGWLARNAHEALAVWSGEDQFVGRLVRSLQDHLGEEQVWVLAP